MRVVTFDVPPQEVGIQFLFITGKRRQNNQFALNYSLLVTISSYL